LLSRDFDYQLPAEAIAQEPAPRGESRLLVLDAEGAARHRRIADLPRLLRPGDLLVVNDTRVLPARLYGRPAGRGTATAPEEEGAEAAGGPRVEILLVERCTEREWEVLVRPGRRARPGARIELDAAAGLDAEVLALAGDGRRRVRFSQPIEPHLERLGHVPLPPYIHRPDDAADRERYQTVFARHPGAIAAPTAGLHFSPPLLAELTAGGIEVAAVTLHVGIGTFKPVTAKLVSEHRMDFERYAVPPETAAAVSSVLAERRAGRGSRRIVAVGTTVVRTLEAAAAAAANAADAGTGEVPAGSGRTDLFITPGYQFRVVDVLLTNFHLPCSTLLMLVAAFAGRERVLAAYQEALALGYRFFSYGDAMLAERAADAR
jgi:S-adenosylmethionine:tRNA ribosyltransferase-isomerase